MTIIEASNSLKLECAIRNLGFLELKYQVVAHAGIYFVVPVTYRILCDPEDDALGFQVLEQSSYTNELGLRVNMPLLQTAKAALDLALGG